MEEIYQNKQKQQNQNSEYSYRFKFVNFSHREKRKLLRSTNYSQPEVNQEAEAAVSLETKKNDYNVSRNCTESTLLKSFCRKDAHYSGDPLLANNSAHPDKVLNETAN